MRVEPRTWLREAGLDPQAVDDVVRAALAEDGTVDVTSEPIFPAGAVAGAEVVTRQSGVVAGLPVAAIVFETLGLSVKALAADGDRVAAGDVLLSAEGPLLGLLRAERTALNFLTHLSGVATLTRRWADAIEGTGARVRDTRKTLPGLRALQKYAVRCGGGVNHRMSLQDAALIKDNHIAAAGSVTAAFTAVRAPGLHVQVECDTLDQVREALDAGASAILLDNMGIAEMTEAVRLAGGRAELEASGGLTLDRARRVAETGVDYLAVGALTHSAPSLDIGLDLT
jgi:nicotinate-nucleotide pyrophosphorylase (carboxylating)